MLGSLLLLEEVRQNKLDCDSLKYAFSIHNLFYYLLGNSCERGHQCLVTNKQTGQCLWRSVHQFLVTDNFDIPSSTTQQMLPLDTRQSILFVMDGYSLDGDGRVGDDERVGEGGGDLPSSSSAFAPGWISFSSSSSVVLTTGSSTTLVFFVRLVFAFF